MKDIVFVDDDRDLLDGLPPEGLDLILVGDLFYDAKLARRVIAFLDRLLDSAKPAIEQGTSVVLFTPQNVELGLGERIRGGLVVVSVDSPAAKSWFKFDPAINFHLCVPPEQEAGIVG